MDARERWFKMLEDPALPHRPGCEPKVATWFQPRRGKLRRVEGEA